MIVKPDSQFVGRSEILQPRVQDTLFFGYTARPLAFNQNPCRILPAGLVVNSLRLNFCRAHGHYVGNYCTWSPSRKMARWYHSIYS